MKELESKALSCFPVYTWKVETTGLLNSSFAFVVFVYLVFEKIDITLS